MQLFGLVPQQGFIRKAKWTYRFITFHQSLKDFYKSLKNKLDLKDAIDSILNQTIHNRSTTPIKPSYTKEENEVLDSLNNLFGKLVHDVAQRFGL